MVVKDRGFEALEDFLSYVAKTAGKEPLSILRRQKQLAPQEGSPEHVTLSCDALLTCDTTTLASIGMFTLASHVYQLCEVKVASEEDGKAYVKEVEEAEQKLLTKIHQACPNVEIVRGVTGLRG